MPTVEIEHALAGSHVDAAGFTATGTWDNTSASTITCEMVPGSGASVPGSVTLGSSGNTWSAAFGPFTQGTYTLRAAFTGASDAVEPDIHAVGPTDPLVRITEAIELVATVKGKLTTLTYTVRGDYRTGATGKGGVCLAVTRDRNKKIASVLGAAFIDMRAAAAGNWQVSFQFADTDLPADGKLTFVALMLDENAEPVAQAGRGKKRP